MNNGLGVILKRQRLSIPLTLQEMAKASKVSSSHLGRIERGERNPSARILRKIAQPLGFKENELFRLAGFLSPQEASEEGMGNYGKLDPIVASLLAEEPVEVQRTVVIGLLSIIKTLAKAISKENK
jgi:transcriptional regulator with XRE-family HTH domain